MGEEAGPERLEEAEPIIQRYTLAHVHTHTYMYT